jgi:hypothetical protein
VCISYTRGRGCITIISDGASRLVQHLQHTPPWLFHTHQVFKSFLLYTSHIKHIGSLYCLPHVGIFLLLCVQEIETLTPFHLAAFIVKYMSSISIPMCVSWNFLRGAWPSYAQPRSSNPHSITTTMDLHVASSHSYSHHHRQYPNSSQMVNTSNRSTVISPSHTLDDCRVYGKS